MSYDVLEGDTVYVTELHASDFVKKDFVIKRGVICARTYTLLTLEKNLLQELIHSTNMQALICVRH